MKEINVTFTIEELKDQYPELSDFGVGVFQSLDNKQIDSKFYLIRQKLYRTFGIKTNDKILNKLLSGEMHLTATGEPHRGRGLPGIKHALDHNRLSSLHIITNNVFADVSNGKYILLNSNFSGTFVYWELTKNNRSLEESD